MALMASEFLNSRLSFQSKLTILMLSAATLYALVVGLVAFNAGKQAVTDQALNHLDAIRETRGTAVANYLKLYRTHVQTLIESDDVVNVMRDFPNTFNDLGSQDFDSSKQQELLEFYRTEQIPRLAKNVDGEPVPEQMMPTSSAGQKIHISILIFSFP